jgi:tRNA threonylcarbamoyladenosine biosynthesis protein TsaB
MELSIDTASDWASIAISDEGSLLGEMTWRCERQHSVQLLPAVEALLARLAVDKHALTAVFVCIGPGGYAGLRVGVSTAKGLAFALPARLIGVGRLEAEAYQLVACGRPVCAVHRAGRGELAWAVYQGPQREWRELLAPRLSPPEALLADAPADALFVSEEGDGAEEMLSQAGAEFEVSGVRRRAGFLAQLGWRRLLSGQVDDPRALTPLYLREPAIGPPKK